MRHCQLIGIAALAAIIVSAMPALSLDRPARPDSASIVTRIADLDRPSAPRSHARNADAHWHWRYRAAYVRWLHHEYVRAGHPVRHYDRANYVQVDRCCCCTAGRHW